MTSAPEGKLVETVRIFAVLVVRVGVVVHQSRRIDRIKVGRVRLVKDLRTPRSALSPERFRKVDSVEVRMLLDVLRSVALSQTAGGVGAEAPDQILGLEGDETLRDVERFAPPDNLEGYLKSSLLV